MYSEHRSVHYAGNSLVIGLTATGTNVLGVDDGDDLEVEVHDDGFWINVSGGPDD
jgi:antitoxin component of MazEF toxin-antitoxin module